jgi:hypothetical protein
MDAPPVLVGGSVVVTIGWGDGLLALNAATGMELITDAEARRNLQGRGQRCCHDGTRSLAEDDKFPDADALLLSILRRLPVGYSMDDAYCLARPLPVE